MKLLVLVCILAYLMGASALRCEMENIFGMTTYKDCPGTFDEENKVFCCGSDNNVHCCSNPLDLSEKDFEELASQLPAILGTLVAIAIGLIVVCVICCCCCPCCLLAKRRSRGVVHQPAVTQMQPQPMPPYAPVQQAGPYPTNQTYPPQQPQPGYAPQPGYGMPPQPMQAQAPYPTSQAPYPVASEQPPPYTSEKPPAFNPSY